MLLVSSGWRGEPESVGDDGAGGAQHRGDQRREIEMALAGGAHDAGEHLLGVGAVAGAVATADLTDNDGGTDGLFGAPVGGVDRQVPQEETLASELDVLCVFPMAIKRERGDAHVRLELEYLRRCMEATADRLSLSLARERFSKDPMGTRDFTDDALATYYTDLRRELDQGGE